MPDKRPEQMTTGIKNVAIANKYPFLLSLRFIIPLILVLMTLLSFLYINYLERQRALTRIQENSLREVTELAIYLQNILEHLIKENRIDLVQEQIGLLGSNIKLRLVLLANENDNIIASSQRKWIGHNIDEVFSSNLTGEEKLNILSGVETARSHRKSNIIKSTNHASLYTLYPIYSSILGEQLRHVSVCVLYIEYDLSRQTDNSNRRIFLSNLSYLIFFAIAYILLGAAIHLIITRRLIKLTTVVKKFASGEITIRVGIDGKDEITNLASGLNTMFDKIIAAQSDLQNSKDELLNILESISDGFFTLNREWRYTYLNTNAGRMVKRNSKDLIGKIITDEFPEIVDTPYYRLYDNVMNTGEVTHFEYYYPLLERWYEGTVYPYTDGISVYFQDVTERKRLEEQDKTILRTSLDGFIIFNTEGGFIETNDAFCNMTGYTSEDLLNMSLSDIEASESPEETRLHIQQISDVGSDKFETKHKTKDGRIIDVEVSINFIRNSGLIFAFLRDITKRKNMEMQLNELNKNLQRRVTEEVEENRWKDQVMFEQSRHIAMGELLVNIAHHWRQPLNAISVIAQEIRDAKMFDDLTDEYLDSNVNIIMVELQLLSDTIDNFKSFYHVEKEKKRFSIAGAVEKSLSLMEGYFKNRQITIEVDVKNDIMVEGYPNEFSRAILSILNNTKDIFEERGIENGYIKIKLKKGDEAGKGMLCISDNGGGIREDIIGKIFDPYFTTKHKARGIGLGLYIAKSVIEMNMSGSIRAQNTDAGLEVIIEL
ncbi:MAG: PAS domain S-box protein [Nitrospirae bacterium]|nr:PAS domain S-box protein [Nitrospirota bacterium]